MIYLLTASGLPPGGSCTVHIYTQTVHRTTQNKQYIEQHKNFENDTKILEECGPCPDLDLAKKNLYWSSCKVPAVLDIF